MADELLQALDYGFAVRADIHDRIRDATPPEWLSEIEATVRDDPHGAACAIFAQIVERDGGGPADADLEGDLDVALLYQEWKRSKPQ